MRYYARIAGYGHYVPEKILTNEMLEKMVDTSDEWISGRTGIKERRIAREDEYSSDLAYEAGRRALERAGMDASAVELIIVAGITPDMIVPSVSSMMQARLGAVNAAAVDINAACSGFIYALSIANAYIQSGIYRNILLIGADCLSKVTDYRDRNTCVLFGDGAGAVVLTRTEEQTGVLSVHLGSDGASGGVLTLPLLKDTPEERQRRVDNRLQTVWMDGQEVFKFAVKVMASATQTAVEMAGLTMEDINVLIPHQANVRIVDSAVKRMKFDRDKVFVNLHRYGNISGASIPLALSEALEQGFVKKGDTAVLVGFGGGLSWASAVVKFD